MNNKISFITICILLGIILFLFMAYVFKDRPSTTSGYETILQDSIKSLNKQIELSNIVQIKLESEIDSLSHLDPQIIYRTKEKYKFIFSEATPNQLDSIIRSTWKTNLK